MSSGDPRGSSLTLARRDRERLTELLTEAVASEGPVVAIRAYRLVNRASGSRRLTKPARQALNRACALAERRGLVVATDPLQFEGQAQRVLRVPESPEVVIRERGPRELDEIPPDEMATLLRLLHSADQTLEPEALKRQALERLGWVRLTQNASAFLDDCLSLM